MIFDHLKTLHAGLSLYYIMYRILNYNILWNSSIINLHTSKGKVFKRKDKYQSKQQLYIEVIKLNIF